MSGRCRAGGGQVTRIKEKVDGEGTRETIGVVIEVHEELGVGSGRDHNLCNLWMMVLEISQIRDWGIKGLGSADPPDSPELVTHLPSPIETG